MEFANYTLLEHEIYVRENNLTKMFGINLCCYQMIFYKNPKYYFSCFCFTPSKN